MAIAEGQWTIVHGDTSRSPVFAVCTAKGEPVDLESNDWVVRAQARASLDAYDLIYGWSAGHGVELSTGRVELSNGRKVTTSTVGLSLLPGDFAGLPRDWSGIVEIEVASDSTTSPAERYSVARLWTTIVPDVTRDEGTIIVSPGIPAPSAPAGGVLAGSYPNPIFAVPMWSQAQTENAIAAASAADRQRGNHTGTMSADALTDGSAKRAYLAAERTKLAGIAEGATANATDAQLRDRGTHTGSQLSTSISDLAEAVQDIMGASLTMGTNISIAYDDSTGQITISAAGYSGGGGGGNGGISGVRTVSASTNAFTNELLLVNASSGQVTIGPPPSVSAGTQVTLVKVDSSSNLVVWNSPTNGDTSAGFAKRWSGATFTYDGSQWVLTSTNRTSGYSTGGGGSVTFGTTSGTAAEGNDPRLSDTRTPSDATVTDIKVAPNAAIAESKLALASDAVSGTASRRTLGSGAQQAAAGNHTHTVDGITATGTRDNTSFLRGDGVWAAPPGSAGGGQHHPTGIHVGTPTDDRVWYPGFTTGGIHGSGGLLEELVSGTTASPDTTDTATSWIQKFTALNQDVRYHYASGGLVETVKTGGNSAPNSLVANVVSTGGKGDQTGLQGRAVADVDIGTSTDSVISTGIWAASVTPTTAPAYTSSCGLEINVFNRFGSSTTKKQYLTPGTLVGALIYNYSANPNSGAADGISRPNHFGVYLGGNVASSFHTGILIDTIINEGIRFEGSAKPVAGKAGIVFNDTYLTSGIKFTAAMSNDNGTANEGVGIDLGNNRIKFEDFYGATFGVGDFWKNSDNLFFRVANGGSPINTELLMSRGITTVSATQGTRKIAVQVGGAIVYLLATPT